MTPLRAAIPGGTGPFGRGLARRLALGGVSVRIGSRDAARAEAAAGGIREGAGPSPLLVHGTSNPDAVAGAGAVFVAVPFSAQEAVLRELAGNLDGKLVIACGVIWPPGSRPDTSAGEEAERALRAAGARSARVAAALQTVAAGILASEPTARPEDEPDALVFADREEVRAEAARWCGHTGLRSLPAGPLRGARAAEAVLGVLLELNRGPARHAGLRITGVPR